MTKVTLNVRFFALYISSHSYIGNYLVTPEKKFCFVKYFKIW